MNKNAIEIPDGKYLAELLNVSASKRPAGGALVEILLKIIEGDFRDTVIPKKYNLATPHCNACEFLKKELALLGMNNIGNAKELQTRKTEIIGLKLRFTAKTRDDGYQSYYIASVVKEGIANASQDNNVDLDFSF